MRTVLHQLGRFKRDTFLCIGLCTLEVIMEILLPFITSLIIDKGLEQANLPVVYRYGILMVAMALLSLAFGAAAGKFGSVRLGFEPQSSENPESPGTLGLTALFPSPVTGQKSALTTCLTTIGKFHNRV